MANHTQLCDFCKTTSVHLPPYHEKEDPVICRQCDTTNAGTWFLSYISDIGYINNDDVFQGCVTGTTRKNFLGLPNNTQVYIRIDIQDRELFHVIYAKPEDTEDDTEDDVWWQKSSAKKMDFRFDGINGIKLIVTP